MKDFEKEGSLTFNDLHRLAGPEAVRRSIEQATYPDGTNWQAVVDRLSRLSLFEYERARQGEAKALKIRLATLDKEVSKARRVNRRTTQP